MRRITTLPGRKAIALTGRTGSGKSSIFVKSQHVTRVLVADSGSGCHAIYAPPETQVVDVCVDNPKESPVHQTMRLVKQWGEEGAVGLIDSYTTMQEQQVMWHKRFQAKNNKMSLQEHGFVVGDMRDLALYLASHAVFVIFNSSPGGQVRTPEGDAIVIPKGVLVGYPALSGLSEGKESVLARFTSSWIVFPGFTKGGGRGGEQRTIPRGFLVPGFDIRGGEIGNFAPIKDPLRVLKRTPRDQPEGARPEDHKREAFEDVDAFLPLDKGCTIDAMIERIGERFPQIYEGRAQPAAPLAARPAVAAAAAAPSEVPASAPPPPQPLTLSTGGKPAPTPTPGRGRAVA